MASISEYMDKYDLPPEGTCTGTAVVVVDEGVVAGKFGASRQALITYELAGMTTESGHPVLAFKRVFNLSPRSKNLRELLRASLNVHDLTGVDLRDLLGKPVELLIEHVETADGSTYANVEVRRFKGNKKPPAPKSEEIFFSLHPSDFDEKVLEKLPERQRTKIMSGETYKSLVQELKFAASANGKKTADIIDDDFPENLGGSPLGAEALKIVKEFEAKSAS